MESTRHLHQFQGRAGAVYVTNPELRREYEILKASGVYELSNQPAGAAQLTLHPLCQYGRCGNPLMLSFLTLGILPGTIDGAYVFEYDLEADGVVERYTRHLPLFERFSVWEHLVKRDEEKLFGKALAWSYKLEHRPEPVAELAP
jgi:hypothetical protein